MLLMHYLPVKAVDGIMKFIVEKRIDPGTQAVKSPHISGSIFFA